MNPFATLALAALVALPAAAQTVPSDFPDRTEPMSDRVRKDLVERHRSLLSGLYGEGTLAAGPGIGQPGVYGLVAAEGGYRFDSGDALCVTSSVRSPLGLDPVTGTLADDLTGTLGVQLAVGMRRFAPESKLAQRSEVALGVGAGFYNGGTVTALHIAPRVAFPLTPTVSVPVGIRLSQEIGGLDRRGPYVGLSIGLRRIWADEARMVLK